MPAWLKDILRGLLSLISFDLSVLLSSPECAAEMPPRARWGTNVAMTLAIALLLVLWVVVVRCYHKYNDAARRRSVVTILQIAVQVLLLGLFMPSVRISLRILSCEEDPEDPAQRVLKMDGEACTISPRVDTLGAIGLSLFVLYGILPYLTMACVMIREAARGSLRRKLRESDTFFMLFGWAAAPYKESAFFWESVNAATVVSTVTVTELMGGPSRTTAHIIIFSVALVLQIVVRPFDDFYANVSVTLFALCELFGALGELKVAAFQWMYVLTFLFALIVTGKFAVSALVERVKQQRQRPSAAWAWNTTAQRPYRNANARWSRRSCCLSPLQ